MARCGACNQEIGTTALGVYDPSYVHLTEDKRQREVCAQCHRAIGVWSQQESERTKCIMPGCMAIGNPRMRNPNCPHGILVSCQAHWQGTLSCMSRGHWDALMSGSTPDGTPKRLPPAPSVCGAAMAIGHWAAVDGVYCTLSEGHDSPHMHGETMWTNRRIASDGSVRVAPPGGSAQKLFPSASIDDRVAIQLPARQWEAERCPQCKMPLVVVGGVKYCPNCDTFRAKEQAALDAYERSITPSGVDHQQRANAIADECQRLRDENTQLLAENARLRRGHDR